MKITKKVLSVVWLVLILAFIYIPILLLAVYSFTDATMVGGAIDGFTFQNYITLFENEELRNMIGGTVALALGSALIAAILGTLGAIGAFYSRKTAKHLINYANQIPVVNADVVTGFSLCVLLIVLLGIGKDTFVPLVLGHVVLCTPFVYLSVMPRLRGGVRPRRVARAGAFQSGHPAAPARHTLGLHARGDALARRLLHNHLHKALHLRHDKHLRRKRNEGRTDGYKNRTLGAFDDYFPHCSARRSAHERALL